MNKQLTVALGVSSLLFVGLLFFNPNSEYAGLTQRIVELHFMAWIIACSSYIMDKS